MLSSSGRGPGRVKVRRVRFGWYDSSRARGGQNFQVDSKVENKVDYNGDIREYFHESDRLWKSSMSQVWSRWLQFKLKKD